MKSSATYESGVGGKKGETIVKLRQVGRPGLDLRVKYSTSTRLYYPYDDCGQPEQKTAFSWDTIGASRRAYVFPHQQQPQLTTNSYIVVAHY